MLPFPHGCASLTRIFSRRESAKTALGPSTPPQKPIHCQNRPRTSRIDTRRPRHSPTTASPTREPIIVRSKCQPTRSRARTTRHNWDTRHDTWPTTIDERRFQMQAHYMSAGILKRRSYERTTIRHMSSITSEHGMCRIPQRTSQLETQKSPHPSGALG
jgi:hypothetical protein